MKKRCFVIMPFSKTSKKHTAAYWTEFYNSLITLLPDHDVVRSQGVGNIPKRIFSELATADLVIAVITDENANVFYELGMRHSCQQHTVLLIEKGKSIPFYFRPFGVLEYEAGNKEKLREDLAEYLKTLDIRSKDNPIADVINTGILVAIHRSMAVLYDAIRLVRKHPSPQAQVVGIREALRSLQKPKEHQVTIVSITTDRVVIHNEIQEHTDAHALYNDATLYRTRDKSRQDVRRMGMTMYPWIKQQKEGFLLAPLDDWWENQKRLTAVSFQTLDDLQWLVMAEAHFKVGDLKLIEREQLRSYSVGG